MKTRAFVLGGVLGLALTWGLAARGEEPIPTDLSAVDAQAFLGNWKVSIEVMERKIELFLNIVDIGGQVGATLDSPRQPEPLAISHIQMTPEGQLDMSSELTFGGSFTIDINILLALEGGALTGRIKDKGGIFDAPVVGERVSAEELDSVQGQRPSPTEARANYGGQRIRIAFADLRKGTSDWKLFEELADGQIYEFTLSRATKMYTDFDLKFGDVVIKKENVAKDYPGVYSLWLRKAGDGWNLVFNNQPDIWGTRHEDEFDAAEIPLRFARVEGEPSDKLKVEIDQTPEGGTLRFVWDNNKWEADYTLVQ
jgi:hypothetical protein